MTLPLYLAFIAAAVFLLLIPGPTVLMVVGYGLADSVQGNGYATEALSAVVGWAAAQGVVAVEAMTAPDNVPSHRVLERCGFERAGEIDADEGRLLRWLRRLR